jgi:prevent-host-death family protein
VKELQLKDAKANLSRVLDDATEGEPTVITRHGKKEGVLISYGEYERLKRVPSLGWLLANSPLEGDDLPERRPARALRKSAF